MAGYGFDHGDPASTLRLRRTHATSDLTALPRGLRLLEGLAALLSAGILLIGVLLTVLVVAAPALIAGSGLAAPAGPRLDRALVPLVVGLLGELGRWRRTRLPTAARVVVAVLLVVAVAAALWWGWWR